MYVFLIVLGAVIGLISSHSIIVWDQEPTLTQTIFLIVGVALFAIGIHLQYPPEIVIEVVKGE